MVLVDQKNICVQREVWDQTYEINTEGNYINDW